jgi:hypothetical protein
LLPGANIFAFLSNYAAGQDHHGTGRLSFNAADGVKVPKISELSCASRVEGGG